MSVFSAVTHEQNSKRKSHRITIPIEVILNNRRYRVVDWSMNGMKISLQEDEKDFSLKIDESSPVKVILPTGESSILLDMEVTLRNIYKRNYGVEITKINEKNKKVLRHYATLAIDGNIDHIDNVSADLFMSNIPTPIKEPIVLKDKESKDVHKKFLKKFFINTVLGIVFLLVLFVTFIYNYVIVKDTVGFIAGNSTIYYAPFDGILRKIYVKENEVLSKGQLLFAMEDDEAKEQLKILESTQKKLQDELRANRAKLAKYEEYAKETLQKMNMLQKSEKSQIENYLDTQKKTYEKARYLYERQLISFREFSDVESRYLSYKENYNAVVHQKRSLNQYTLVLEQNYNKNQDHILSLNNSIALLVKTIEQNKLEIATLNKVISNAMVRSKSTAKVHTINAQEGDSLNFADRVLMVQTSKKPFVLVKLLSSKIGDINIGSLCIVQSTKDDTIYIAHVTGVGYPAIDGINVGANELSQNNVPIKIEFDDVNQQFDLNEYMHVYIINNSYLSYKIVENMLGVSLND